MLNLAAFRSSSPAFALETQAVNVACHRLSKKALLAALLTAVSAGHAFAEESFAQDSFAQATEHLAFQFTNIADNTSSFTGFTTFPAINSRGTVVFQATGPKFTDGIFEAQNGEITTVAAGNALTLFGQDPVINDAGVVAFEANLNTSTRAIFTFDGTSTKTIVNTTEQGLIARFLGSPSINRFGAVAFFSPRTGFRSQAVFIGDGGPLTAIADTTNSNFSGFENVAISDLGKVTFGASTNDGNTGIFVTSTQRGRDGEFEAVPDGTIDIIDTNNPNFTGFGDPVINVSGTIADEVFRSDGSIEVLTGDRKGVTARTDITTNAFLEVEHPSINDEGAVAFFAIRNDGSQVILLATPNSDKPVPVIQSGDPLFGSVVTSIDLGRFALNNRFQMAFEYTLEDGRTGIAIASLKGDN